MSITRPNRMDAINIEEKSDMGGASAFGRYVGIDYSGAETADSSLLGLRMYIADRTSPPGEVQPPVRAGRQLHAKPLLLLRRSGHRLSHGSDQAPAGLVTVRE